MYKCITMRTIIITVSILAGLLILASVIYTDYYDLQTGHSNIGKCVIVSLGESQIDASIYAVRGDGRYTIKYISSQGSIETATIRKMFVSECQTAIDNT